MRTKSATDSKPKRTRRPGAGRPPKPLTERAAHQGNRIAIYISLDAARQLAALMLRPVPGVRTPAEMIAWLIRQAGEQE